MKLPFAALALASLVAFTGMTRDAVDDWTAVTEARIDGLEKAAELTDAAGAKAFEEANVVFDTPFIPVRQQTVRQRLLELAAGTGYEVEERELTPRLAKQALTAIDFMAQLRAISANANPSALADKSDRIAEYSATLGRWPDDILEEYLVRAQGLRVRAMDLRAELGRP